MTRLGILVWCPVVNPCLLKALGGCERCPRRAVSGTERLLEHSHPRPLGQDEQDPPPPSRAQGREVREGVNPTLQPTPLLPPR